MSWFRSNSGKFAWVAFFALACQFALTFGHVHFANVSVISVALGSSDAANNSAGAQIPPAQQTPTSLAQDFCAVCNTISLANTLILPVAPPTNPPISFMRNLQWSLAATELTSRDHFHFDARGPPHA